MLSGLEAEIALPAPSRLPAGHSLHVSALHKQLSHGQGM